MITWTTEDDQLFINLEDKNHIFSLFFFLQSLPVLVSSFCIGDVRKALQTVEETFCAEWR